MFKSKNITQEKTMDEIISLILQGCNLAKDLEINLQSLSNQPENLSKLCEDIIRVFIDARGRLNAHQQQDPTSLLYRQHHHVLFREAQQLQQQQQINFDPSIQEWLRTSCTSAMELIHQTQLMAAHTTRSGSAGLIEGKAAGGIKLGSSSDGGVVIELGRGRDIQAMDASDSGKGVSSSSSSQRPRRRTDDGTKQTIRVPAHQFGNTEIPPEDGFTWRKYGQKEILGSRFPRGYYRCTHQKLYHCPAKKQVQRLDNDPYTFEVTYRGEHTCHMSATAPSVPPPPPPSSAAPEITQEMAETRTSAQPPSSAASSLARWLEFSLGGGGAGGSTTTGSSSSSVAAGLTSGAGPSTVGRYGKEAADSSITDMADVMFNSGSSSTNSMEFLFPSMEDKWDQPDDKKN